MPQNVKLNKKNIFILAGLLFTLPFAVFLTLQTVILNNRAGGGQSKVEIVPNSGTFAVGREFQVKIKITPAGEKKIVIATILLNFDPDQIEILDVRGSDLFANKLQLEAKTEEGKIIIKQGAAGSDPSVGGQVDFATIKMRPKSPADRSVISFDDQNSKIVDSQASYLSPNFNTAEYKFGQDQVDPTAIPFSTNTPFPTQVPTIGPTSTPVLDWPVLNFQVKLAGTSFQVGEEEKVVGDIPPQKFNLKVVGNNIQKEFLDIPVLFDKNAVGVGQVNLVGVNPGDNYGVILKGPMHVAKRFCRDNQVGTCSTGQAELSFSNGMNYYDWTGSGLLPGDINQDGRVDSLDFSRVKLALNQTGQYIPSDLNCNEKVNTQDIILLLNTLATAYEDES